MPENWIDQHVGDESRPSAGFEDALAERLHRAWRGGPSTPGGPSRRTRWWVVGAAAAVVAAAILAVVFVDRDQTHHITADTTVTTGAPTVLPTTSESTVPASTVPTTVPTTTPAIVAQPVDADQQAVFDYLLALQEQRWADAATALRNSLDDTERVDLRPLFTDLADLPSALRQWCGSGALCIQPSKLVTAANGWVSVTFVVRGHSLTQHFRVTADEGKQVVHGLPMQLPTGTNLAEVVPCDVAAPYAVVPADLNGDGWYEQVEADGDGVLHVCGTTLPIAPTGVALVAGAPVEVYPIDVQGNGRDELLVGYQHGDGFQGGLYSPGDSGFSYLTGAYTSVLTNTTVGCATFNGAAPVLAQVSWKFSGGSTQETATAVRFTYTPLWPSDQQGVVTDSGTGMSPTSPQAVAIMNGLCGDRPIFTH